MKKKQIELGNEFYVFTNWGICNGIVVEITKEDQYRLNIDIDADNLDKEHNFYYCADELFSTFEDAINAQVRGKLLLQMREGEIR
jgi:hypothetical protein